MNVESIKAAPAMLSTLGKTGDTCNDKGSAPERIKHHFAHNIGEFFAAANFCLCIRFLGQKDPDCIIQDLVHFCLHPHISFLSNSGLMA